MFSGHGGPGHKFIDAVGVMAIGEAGEGLGQPRVRIDAAEFAVFDQRCDHRPVIAAFVRSGE